MRRYTVKLRFEDGSEASSKVRTIEAALTFCAHWEQSDIALVVITLLEETT